MKTKLFLLLGIAATTAYSQGFFTKGLTKLAKAVGDMQVQKVATLDDVVLTVNFSSNLHTDKLGTISQTWIPGWKTGGDAVYIMMSRKNTAGYFKLDGSVTMNGKPLEYASLGGYALVTEPSNAARKIEISTTAGHKAAFTLEPLKNHVKLLAVNGQKDGEIKIDMTKDLVLDLAVPAGMEGAPIKASIAINQISVKSMYDICWLRAAPKVTIPASALRNLAITPASTVLYSFKGSYLSIGSEAEQEAKDVSGHFKAVKYSAQYQDGKLVTISTEPKLNTGLVAKGEDKALDMKYDFFKPNAYFSRPSEQIRTIGLKSFAIRGTTYSQSSSTHETSTQIITKTTTLEFPKQPDAVWDTLMERMYPDFMAVVESEFGAKALPVETVTGTEAYKAVTPFAKDGQNTKVNFDRAFRNTKVMSAFIPVSEGYGNKGAEQRMMDQSGADALLTMTMDLEISSDGKLVLMVPKFGFEITGKTNGPISGTKFASGNIQSITGVSFNKDINQEQLEKIIRKSDMLTVFRKGLQELKEKEKANGDYGPVWALQAPAPVETQGAVAPAGGLGTAAAPASGASSSTATP